MKSASEKLVDAAWGGDVPALEVLLGSGEDLGLGAITAALEAAAYNAQPEAADLLLSHGADANFPTS